MFTKIFRKSALTLLVAGTLTACQTPAPGVFTAEVGSASQVPVQLPAQPAEPELGFSTQALRGNTSASGNTPGSWRADNKSIYVSGFDDFVTYEVKVTGSDVYVPMWKQKNGQWRFDRYIRGGETVRFTFNSRDFDFDSLYIGNAVSASPASYQINLTQQQAAAVQSQRAAGEPNLNAASYRSPVNPFARGQCTWYVFGRVQEVSGVNVNFTQNWGRHGKNWYHLVSSLSKGSTPRPGAIAVWDDGGAYGHVAYVEAVDGDRVTISEANWSPSNAYNGRRVLSNQQMQNRGKYRLLGYLYTR